MATMIMSSMTVFTVTSAVGVGEESTAVVGHADTFTVNFAHQLVVGMTGADVIVAQGRE